MKPINKRFNSRKFLKIKIGHISLTHYDIDVSKFFITMMNDNIKDNYTEVMKAERDYVFGSYWNYLSYLNTIGDWYI